MPSEEGAAVRLRIVLSAAAMVAIVGAGVGPAVAAPTLELSSYSGRVEAVGVSAVANDSVAQLFPFLDFALPRAAGSLDSATVTGLATVFDPGTVVRTGPTLLKLNCPECPPLPTYPFVAETHAGENGDATVGGPPSGAPAAPVDAALFTATSHSDESPRTEQMAVLDRVAVPAGAQAAVKVGSVSATTFGRAAGRTVTLASVVSLRDLQLPVAGIVARSLDSRVALKLTPGQAPKVERSFAVQGLAVGGKAVVTGPEPAGLDELRNGVRQNGVTLRAVEGGAKRQSDGGLLVASDVLQVEYPLPGSTAVVKLVLGSTAAKGAAALGAATVTGDTGADRIPVPGSSVTDAVPETPTEPAATPDLASSPAAVLTSAPLRSVGVPTAAARITGGRRVLAASRGGLSDRSLVLLYLTWFTGSAALVAAGFRVVRTRRPQAPRPELFD